MLCLLPQKAGVACTRMTDTQNKTHYNPAERQLLQAKPDRRSSKAVKAEAIVPGCRTQRERAATAFIPEGSGRPGYLAPRSRRPPANAVGARTAGVSPAASGRARQAGGDPLTQFPQPLAPRQAVPRVSAPRRPVPGTRAGPRRALSPQPARCRCVRPHLTATRTELSSGAPHMLAAGDSRAPGLLHRGTEAPPGLRAPAQETGAAGVGRLTSAALQPCWATEWKGGGDAEQEEEEVIHGWRASAPSPPLTPHTIWGGDKARLNGERGGGGASRPPAASRRRGECALPPPLGTRPASRRAEGSTPAGRSGLLAPHCVSAGRPAGPHRALPAAGGPPCPRQGTAWRCWAGRRAGEGCRPQAAHVRGR